MDKMLRQMIKRRDDVFFNVMTVEVVMELVGIFTDNMELAEVAVVAMGTTLALWHIFLASDKRMMKKRVMR